MAPARTDRPYPDAAELAGHVALLHGLRHIVDVGLSWTPELAIVFPELRATGALLPGDDPGQAPSAYQAGKPLSLADWAAGGAALGRLDSARSALLAAGPARRLCGDEGALEKLSDLVAEAPIVIVATDDAEPVLRQLAGLGIEPEFVGRTRAHAEDVERSGHLILVDRVLARARAQVARAPSEFRVVAIMTAYNEEDVIGPAIGKLVDDGVGVYVIDNWSTDRTNEIVRGFEGKGLVGFERFPEAPSDRFVLKTLLRRVTAVAAGLQADWFIHHDADERRTGPWPGLGLRESLWRVDRAGFSAVDHTVVNYRPIDNAFEPGGDFEGYFRNFEFGQTSDLLLQIKAWKNVGRADLAKWGGHQAVFSGRRVFPYKFLLKHYPVRSQAHGERKIFRERVARWDPGERARGWHVHYNDVAPEQSFVWDRAGLIEDRGAETRTLYLPEMLTGAGLTARDFPPWALGGKAGRSLYLTLQAIEQSRTYGRIRRLVSAPRGIVRRLRRTKAGR
jgi:glycosyltransferase involved in cell wall biosynthesis